MTIQEATFIREYKNGKLTIDYILNWANEWDETRKEVADKLHEEKKKII